MKIENDYPKIKKEVNKFLAFRKITLIIFLLSIIVCTIVNLSIGGKKWMFYVIAGEVIYYYAILNKPLINNTIIKRATVLIIIICGYLYMIDIIEKTSWSYFVINILLFCVIIIQLLLFFTEFRHQKKEMIPLFLTAIGAMVFCLLAVIKVVEINWAVIVLGSLGLASIVMLLIFYYKPIKIELKKYWSIK